MTVEIKGWPAWYSLSTRPRQVETREVVARTVECCSRPVGVLDATLQKQMIAKFRTCINGIPLNVPLLLVDGIDKNGRVSTDMWMWIRNEDSPSARTPRSSRRKTAVDDTEEVAVNVSSAVIEYALTQCAASSSSALVSAASAGASSSSVAATPPSAEASPTSVAAPSFGLADPATSEASPASNATTPTAEAATATVAVSTVLAELLTPVEATPASAEPAEATFVPAAETERTAASSPDWLHPPPVWTDPVTCVYQGDACVLTLIGIIPTNLLTILAKGNATQLLSVSDGLLEPVRVHTHRGGMISIAGWYVDTKHNYFHEGQRAYLSEGPAKAPARTVKYFHRRKRWR